MGTPLTAQVGKLELLRLLFMPSFLLGWGAVSMFGTADQADQGLQMGYLGVALWLLALWPLVLLVRALLERARGQNQVVIDGTGITLRALDNQAIPWRTVDRIEIDIRKTMDHAGSGNFIVNLLRTNYKVYVIKLSDANPAWADKAERLEIVPLELSVSAAQAEAALASWAPMPPGSVSA